MNVAIMQPYFFPYIGYWQLLKACETLVVYDDVAFMKGGWISRNRILVNGHPSWITVPLVDASPNRGICDHRLVPTKQWRAKLLRTIYMSYRRSRYFEESYPLVESVLNHETNDLAAFLLFGIRSVARHLDLGIRIVPSSRLYGNAELRGQTRVVDICRREGASTYVNPIGGTDLYEECAFAQQGIYLRFVSAPARAYPQHSTEFVPRLSIIDGMMSLGRDGLQPLLADYRLSRGGQIEADSMAGLLDEVPRLVASEAGQPRAGARRFGPH